MKIVVVGHVCLDMIPKWNCGGLESIIPGHIVEMDGIKIGTGGAVANTGGALIRLGVDTTLVGKIGQDEIGSLILKVLNRLGNNITDNMIITPGETSSYTVVLSPPGTDRVFLHYPGTNDTFSFTDVPFDKIKEAQLFHFGYPQLMRKMYQDRGDELVRMIKEAKHRGFVTSLDMAKPDSDSDAASVNWEVILERILPHVDLFLPSIDEMLFMLDKKKYKEYLNGEDFIDLTLLEEMGEKLLSMGTGIVMLKLGEDGLYLQTGNLKGRAQIYENRLGQIINLEEWSGIKLLAPCFKTEVKGTTGSGDATIAGFLASFVEGGTPEQAAIQATAVGAFSVEDFDAIGGIRPLEEVMKRVKKGWNHLPVSFPTMNWKRDVLGIWKEQDRMVGS